MHLANSSSVLLVAAHPDDIKNCTGVILRCLELGAQVSEILVTKGEALHFRSTDSREDAVEMGKKRQKELLRFYSEIGMAERDLAIIGIPDGGITLAALREDFFKAEGDPFYDPILLTDRVIYGDAHRPGMPFYGESLLEVIMESLVVGQPTQVFTHHPKDDHSDHRAVFSFVTRAIEQAVTTGDLKQKPDLYASLVYFKRLQWPPEGTSYLSPDIRERSYGFDIVQFPLTKEEFERKRQACMI
ncbi:MAG: PIG-L family deacetylase, partial [Deltaproteobacteria bacterium]|nr:PIG-L family deacetylase [Deltaproteobacteria bacterium]